MINTKVRVPPLVFDPEQAREHWERIKDKIDKETFRISLYLQVSKCKNYRKGGRCYLPGTNPDTLSTCHNCCLSCDKFLICQSSFLCPLIDHELKKLQKGVSQR